MNKSTFIINKMDCPSEEQIIKMKLNSFKNIKNLLFDIPNRKLEIFYEDDISEIEQALISLNFGSKKSQTIKNINESHIVNNENRERKALWIVLLINFFLFIAEMTTGILSDSMGLVADSLDMFADAVVYALSIMAVGTLITTKKRVAKISGYFQFILAIIGLIEVIRRFIGNEQLPIFQTMVVVSIVALIGNSISYLILNRVKSGEAHMQASMIFTSNDIIVNLGVIVAGVLVYITSTGYPDLIIGSLVFLLVARGAYRILKL